MAASDIQDLDSRLGTLTEPTPEPPPKAEEDGQGAPMTLVEHLEELRRRALISLAAVALCSILGFIFWERILDLLLSPLPNVSSHLLGPHQKLIQTHLGEAFMISLKLAIAAGIALASPVIIYQLWAYVSPALTRKERKFALPFTLLGGLLFAIGLVVGFVVLRYPVDWLINFGDNHFVLLLDASAYFSFVAFFLLAFGVVFELPLVVTLLGVAGITSSAWLRQKRKYILFGLWFLSCFITPGADPYSPIIIAASFTILFELSIVLLRLLKK
jgi:sec-independent protein translocase protein TatC